MLALAGFLWVEAPGWLADPETVLDHYEDDAYYNFQVARNVARGRGMTFDGVSPTNGVHPAVFLTALPLFLASGKDDVLPLRLYGILLLGLYVLIGRQLWVGSRNRLSNPARWVLMAVWFGSQYFRCIGLKGCDGLWAAFFSLSALLAYARESAREPPRWWRVGLWSALAILTRLDQAALVAAFIADRWIRRGRSPTKASGESLRIALLPVLAAAVLLMANQLYLGSPMPDNGRAVKAIAHGVAFYDEHFGARDRLLTLEEMQPLHTPMDLASISPLKMSLIGTGMTLVSLADAFLWDPWAHENLPGRWNPPPAGILLIAAALGAALHRIAAFRRHRPAGWGVAAGLYPLFILLGYNLFIGSYWAYSRYFYPAVLAGGLAIGESLDARIEWRGKAGRTIATAIYSLAFALASWFIPSEHLLYVEATPNRAMIDDIERLTPPNARIGAFQSGSLAYRTHRQVFNLDGKVSHAALEAYAEGRMDAYVKSLGIDYLIDWPFVINYSFFFRSTRPDAFSLQPLKICNDPYRRTLYRLIPREAEAGNP